MLFDGELLRTFENLVVAEGSAQATGIKNSIEENLGIPILRTAFEAAEAVVKHYKKLSKEQFAKDTEYQLVSSKINELDLAQETAMDEQVILSDKLKTYNEEIQFLSDKLHDSEQALLLIERRKDRKQQIKQLGEKRKQTQEELKTFAQDLWLLPLRKAVEPLKQDFQQPVSILNEQEKEKQSKTIELLKLQNSLLRKPVHMWIKAHTRKNR